jgi:hypothetical protein
VILEIEKKSLPVNWILVPFLSEKVEIKTYHDSLVRMMKKNTDEYNTLYQDIISVGEYPLPDVKK